MHAVREAGGEVEVRVDLPGTLSRVELCLPHAAPSIVRRVLLHGSSSGTGYSITVTSLRLAYPTTAEDWPRWRSPVVPEAEPDMIRMEEGTAHVALHPEDLAAAVRAAVDRERGGVYEAIAVTAASHAIDDDAAERLLGWRPRHVKEPGA